MIPILATTPKAYTYYMKIKALKKYMPMLLGKTSDTTNVLLFRIQNAYKTEARLHGD